MAIVDSPPHTEQLSIDTTIESILSSQCPRLVSADEVHSVYAALKMPVCRDVLIIPAWSTIVREAEALPFPEVHVQQALISSIKTYATLCKGQ